MPGLLILMLIALVLVLVAGGAAVAHRLTHPPRLTYGTQVARELPTDPHDLGFAFTTRAIPLERGRSLEAWEVEGGREDGPTLIMLHAWGNGRLGQLAWLNVLQPVAGRLVLFDQRGHGESSEFTCEWGGGECADARAVIEDVRLREPGRPIVLFGCSMGAMVAIETAIAAGPERVAGVIADSPYRHPAEAVRQYMRMRHLPTWPLVELAAIVMRFSCPAFADYDTTDRAAQLRQPLLVFHGADDAVVPLEHASAIVAAAADARLEVFVGAAHLKCAQHPLRYQRAVARFLREISRRGNSGTAAETRPASAEKRPGPR